MGPRKLVGSGVAATAALCFVGAGAPRLTLRNDAILIDYPAQVGLALIAAAALVAIGASRARRAGRFTLVALALSFAGLGTGRLAYSMVASGEELRQKSLFGSRVLAWKTISRVDLEAGRIVAWGAGDTRIRVGTARLTADQRASLERTISRRVYEATTPALGEGSAPGSEASPGRRPAAEPSVEQPQGLTGGEGAAR